jgi:hypothetical protein
MHLHSARFSLLGVVALVLLCGCESGAARSSSGSPPALAEEQTQKGMPLSRSWIRESQRGDAHAAAAEQSPLPASVVDILARVRASRAARQQAFAQAQWERDLQLQGASVRMAPLAAEQSEPARTPTYLSRCDCERLGHH